MGQVRTIPENTQDGGQSGQVSLEITYGGKESPFGGIDTSAPPAYIDPRCFADVDGFLVVDNQLVAVSLTPSQKIDLTGIAGVLKVGTFYTSNLSPAFSSIVALGYLNYAFSVDTNNSGTNPNALSYIFTMYCWNSTGVILAIDSLVVQLQPAFIPAVAAKLTIPVVMGQPGTFTDSGSLGIYCPSPVGSVSFGYAAGATVSSVVAGLVAAINASPSFLFTAAPSADGLSIILTAMTPGVGGNTLNVQDLSTNITTPANTPPFYLGIGKNGSIEYTSFTGGAAAITISVPTSFTSPTVTAVGGTLYIANLGPIILKYSGPKTLAVSSMYAGVKVLGKFAGSLIGLCPISQLGQVLQNRDMIISWTEANNLDEWSPVNSSGNVTGAGFTQLDDIDDPLIGLIISNSTLFIIRTNGISYATALGNGALPFSFQHIGLGAEGEGAIQPNLVAQYNETGAYVGHTDIFKVAGGIQSIGEKISSRFFTAFDKSIGPADSNICAYEIGDKVCPFYTILLDNTLYIYNITNGTWSVLTFINPAGPDGTTYLTTLSSMNSSTAIERTAIQTLVFPGAQKIYSITEGIKTPESISNVATVTFPQEELLFGRDVVINSIYFSMNASASLPNNGTIISFYINNILFATYNVDPTIWTSVDGNPTEVVVYPTSVGVFTSKSPQLTIKVTTQSEALIRFSKIQLYGSMEPAQRPVS